MRSNFPDVCHAHTLIVIHSLFCMKSGNSLHPGCLLAVVAAVKTVINANVDGVEFALMVRKSEACTDCT